MWKIVPREREFYVSTNQMLNFLRVPAELSHDDGVQKQCPLLHILPKYSLRAFAKLGYGCPGKPQQWRNTLSRASDIVRREKRHESVCQTTLSFLLYRNFIENNRSPLPQRRCPSWEWAETIQEVSKQAVTSGFQTENRLIKRCAASDSKLKRISKKRIHKKACWPLSEQHTRRSIVVLMPRNLFVWATKPSGFGKKKDVTSVLLVQLAYKLITHRQKVKNLGKHMPT